MKQANLKLNLNVKKTRKQVFLDQMEQVVPWAALVELIAPVLPGRQDRAATVFCANHAAGPLHAAVVYAVRSSHGRGLL